MNDRIVPGPSLTPVATAVDRFVAPVREVAGEDPMMSIARSLEQVNPALQGYIKKKHGQYVEEEEAAGIRAEGLMDPAKALEENRKGWQQMIGQQRKADAANGTNYADKMAALSPHFRRGMYKARAQRLGLALDDHLAALYSRNPQVEIGGQVVGLHDIDDAAVLNRWVQEQTNTFAAQFGLDAMDPVLTAEVFTPLAAQAGDRLMSHHTGQRLERFQNEYVDEMSAGIGLSLAHAGNSSSDLDRFIPRMIKSESSNKRDVVNDLGYTGWLQIGQDRLTDFNRANGKNYKLSDLRGEGSEERQLEVGYWHFNDIDSTIQAKGWVDQGWSLDGLRAVAHLGGKNGMEKFVMTNGGYNPDDSYINKQGKRVKGTSLMEYYTKFSGPTEEIQSQLDEAVANGISPAKANELVVNSVINSALEQRNPALLGVLDTISTGSGSLGKIGWVKEKVRQAEERISDLTWQEETRASLRDERERNEAARLIGADAFKAILADPMADHSTWTEQALSIGDTGLATALRSMTNAARDDLFKVRTNHEAFIAMRSRVRDAKTDADRKLVQQEIIEGTGLSWSGSDAASLFDDLEQTERNSDYLNDDLVQDQLRLVGKTVRERFGSKDFLGNSVGASEIVATAEDIFYDEVNDWLDSNPEATRAQIRKAARSIRTEILNSEDFVNPIAEEPAKKVGDLPGQAQEGGGVFQLDDHTKSFISTPEGADVLAALAAAAGMDIEEYARRAGILK